MLLAARGAMSPARWLLHCCWRRYRKCIPAHGALCLIWALLGVAMAATLYESAFAVVTQMFAENYRRAITTLTLFGGFASTVFWPFTARLIESFGWRTATSFSQPSSR